MSLKLKVGKIFGNEDKYRPEVFFEETKKERMRKHLTSYNFGVNSFKKLRCDLERRIMILYDAKLSEHFEFYTTFAEVGKILKVEFHCRPFGKGDYRADYKVGTTFINQNESIDREAFMQGFNDCLRKRTGLCFGKSSRKPVVI